MCWRHRVAFLFYFASAVGSRDGSRNPRMGATDRPPAQSFARSLTYSLAREMREEKGSRPRKTTRTRRRERGEERRETSEERNWERIRLLDAKFEVASAKNDLRNEQQREKREESREKKETAPNRLVARPPPLREPSRFFSGKVFVWLMGSWKWQVRSAI